MDVQTKQFMRDRSREIGMMVREARSMRGMSQMDLAGKVGITFQQIQKYEKGSNRISTPMLEILDVNLEVPVTYFLKENPVNGNPIDKKLYRLISAYNSWSESMQKSFVQFALTLSESR